MHFWLVNSGEETPIDPNVRLRRMGLLANVLCERGHQVTWWNADFFHTTKTYRFGKDTVVPINDQYSIRFLYGPGYKKHLSLARIYDHWVIGKKFYRYALREAKPDMMLCSMPTLELASAATRYGIETGVPVVLDIRDFWPNIMVEMAPKPLRPIVSPLFTPYFRMLRQSTSDATAIMGMTPGFVDWGIRAGKRAKTDWDRDFPFGYKEPEMSPEDIEETDRFWSSHGLPLDGTVPIAVYIGMIGRHFQDSTLVEALKMIQKKRDVVFVACGLGDRLEMLQKKYVDLPSLILPGWVNSKEIWRLMNHAAFGLAAYYDTEGFRFSISNKIIEYMAGALPILYSIDESYAAEVIRENELGLTYGNDAHRLADAILQLLENEPRRKQMSENSRRLFLERYQSDAVYTHMAEYLEQLALEKGTAGMSSHPVASS